ncbi:retrotransposable element tf2 protein type 3 [Lasius niger]|uniref:Retrotransposable element tf2 protein type 3 n=1 Tax=Lasius niger TaxID=67767 RepID=A0A0J7JZ63_LASNI|nr:retrotransposable element tf2 protein type 3 [Lasius niger]
MDQFSKFTKLYPMKNQKLETIMDTLQLEYFSEYGVPSEILTDNGGQFITNRWREFAADIGCSVRKTSPYNPQSNPVERVMRELGRIIRVYAHERQTRWDKIVDRAERTINATAHRSTKFRPVELHPGVEEPLKIDPRLRPIEEDENSDDEAELERKIEEAAQTLQKRAQQRKKQTDKHGEADTYQPGDKIWIKLHRRSDANRRLTRKIHLVYDGPYVVRAEVRKNAYLVEDGEGTTLGTFNSRQIKPHREAKLKPIAEINMLRAKQEIKRIARMDIEKFVKDVKDVQKSSETNKSKNKEDIILTDESDNDEEKISDAEKSETETKRNPLDSSKEGGGQRLRRKKLLVSEKGMRHISRLMRLISGKQPLDNVVGLVENQQMKILFDHRGEFNVVTEAAIRQIESKVGRLERLRNSASIPAYLKKEKKIKVRAVKLNIIIANRELNIEAMILNKEEEICVLFGRHACKEMGRKLSKLPKGNDELTRWDIHLTEQDRKKMLKQREKKMKQKTKL